MVPIILSSCLTQNETKIGRENYEGSTLLSSSLRRGEEKRQSFSIMAETIYWAMDSVSFCVFACKLILKARERRKEGLFSCEILPASDFLFFLSFFLFLIIVSGVFTTKHITELTAESRYKKPSELQVAVRSYTRTHIWARWSSLQYSAKIKK